MVLAPALAAGNCVVIKAPELAPYTVMRLAELCLEAGFPPGVVNMLVGGDDVREAMVAHTGVDKLQIACSAAPTQKVPRKTAYTLKPTGLEIGVTCAAGRYATAER